MADDEKRIAARYFLRYLHEQGIIPKYTRRVIIDASVDSAVHIYVEMFGSNKLLTLNLPADVLGAAEVEVIDTPPAEVTAAHDQNKTYVRT